MSWLPSILNQGARRLNEASGIVVMVPIDVSSRSRHAQFSYIAGISSDFGEAPRPHQREHWTLFGLGFGLPGLKALLPR
jgi:hypothetical protein